MFHITFLFDSQIQLFLSQSQFCTDGSPFPGFESLGAHFGCLTQMCVLDERGVFEKTNLDKIIDFGPNFGILRKFSSPSLTLSLIFGRRQTFLPER